MMLTSISISFPPESYKEFVAENKLFGGDVIFHNKLGSRYLLASLLLNWFSI